MKKYTIEIIILLLQILMFYLFPLTAGPTDSMGMIILIIFVSFLLSLFLGIITKMNKSRFFYPVLVSIIFIPTIYIYYNNSAFIYTVFYFIDTFIGLLIGTIIQKTIHYYKK